MSLQFPSGLPSGVTPVAVGGPAVSTLQYDWVKTGHISKPGDWFNATLHIEANGTDTGTVNGTRVDAAGKYIATFAGRTFTIYPVITWAEYPSGIFEVVWQGGVPITGSDTTVKASYDDAWKYFWASRTNIPYPDPEPTIHPITLRFICELWTVRTGTAPNWIDTTCYWMSDGIGSENLTGTFGAPPIEFYFRSKCPALVASLDAAMELNWLISGHEQVRIWQESNSNPIIPENWIWPDECPKEGGGIGTTNAIYRMVSDETSGYVSDGMNVNGVSHRRPSDPTYSFDRVKTISSKAGMTTALPQFGYTLSMDPIYADDHVSATPIAFCTALIGLVNHNLRLGYDTNNDPIEYTDSYTSGSISVSAAGEADTIIYRSTDGGNGYITAEWTDMGCSYQFQGTVAKMDGVAFSVQPNFIDQNGHVWTGSQSPTYVYSGAWTLKIYKLDGTTLGMGNHAPEDDWDGTYWSRTDTIPNDEFNVVLTNPDAFFPSSDGEFSDKRVTLPYPRNSRSISWSIQDQVEIDGLDTLNASGIGGWAGVNCSVDVVDGLIQASGIGADAYLYRADFVKDGDTWTPKHWPAHRFVHLDARASSTGSFLDSGLVPYSGVMRIKRTGGIDTSTKEYGHYRQLYKTVGSDLYPSGIMLDLLVRSDAAGADTTDSYINQALPYDEKKLPDPSDIWQLREKSALSWSWGVGTFDRVELTLASGLVYRMASLQSRFLDPACDSASGITYDDWGKAIYVDHEYRNELYGGDTWMSDDEEDPSNNFTHYFQRGSIGVINGHYGFEAAAIKRVSNPIYAIETYSNFDNKTVFILKGEVGGVRNEGFWPQDDYDIYSFTDHVGDYQASWYSSGITYPEYNTENVLFSPQCSPVYWLDDAINYGSVIPHDESLSGIGSLYIRPTYDTAKLHNWFGDGTDAAERQDKVTVKFVKMFRPRYNGVILDRDNRTPYERYAPDNQIYAASGLTAAKQNAYWEVKVKDNENTSGITPAGVYNKTDMWGCYRTPAMYISGVLYCSADQSLTMSIPPDMLLYDGVYRHILPSGLSRVWNREVIHDASTGLLIYAIDSNQLEHS